jgi:D-aminoacyl-tRNA deacylase
MRAVIQRVKNCSLEINGSYSNQIGQGLLVLVGIEESDSEEDVAWLSGKISRLRIFGDADGVMNLSVCDIQGEVMIVSQFTLHASTRKGNRPAYTRAASPQVAIPIYESFLARMEMELGKPVVPGVFGAHMVLSIVNDGPVTIHIDTKNKE